MLIFHVHLYQNKNKDIPANSKGKKIKNVKGEKLIENRKL